MDKSNSSQGGSRWPTSGNRGVAHGFRNFCITNQGDFFTTDSTEDDNIDNPPLPPQSGTDDSANEALPVANSAVQEHDQEENPVRPESTNSTSSSLLTPIYEGPHTNPGYFSPIPPNGIETITIWSSSSDEGDYDHIPEAVAGLSGNENELQGNDYMTGTVTVEAMDVYDNIDNATITLHENQASSRIKHGPSASSSVSLPSPEDVVPQGNEDNMHPPHEMFVPHKKFNYKSVMKRSRNSAFETARAGANPGLPSVNDLKLSAYINREQAEMRLKAIGSVEETQREIDAFSAIICTGAMYNLSLSEKTRSSKTTTVNDCPDAGSSGLSGHSQGQRSHLQNRQQSSYYERDAASIPAGTGIVDQVQPTIPALHSITTTTCYTTSTALCSGGTVISMQQTANVAGTEQCSNNEAKGDDHDVETGSKMANPGKGYYVVTSPGQASVSDDYEWISD